MRLECRLLGAAVIAGLAVGVRVQTALLTMPLLALVTLCLARRRGPAIVAQVSLGVISGLLAWAVPANRRGGRSQRIPATADDRRRQ